MQSLFDAIQEACSRAVWSRGVELVRAEAVSGERNLPAEVSLRVLTRGSLVDPLVTLYPEDDDWECSCRGRDNPCEHVVAAVIALRRARHAGQELPAPSHPLGRVVYCFEREAEALAFSRRIQAGEQTHTLESTLDALLSGRVAGPRLAVEQRDLQAEHILGSSRRGVLPREKMVRLVATLAGCESVLLNGEPVEVSAEPVMPQGRVVDAPGGVRLFVEADPGITRVFKNGVVLYEQTLRPVGESRLSGRELDELPRGRFYADEQLAEFVTEVLPSLAERIPVEIRSRRLPRTSSKEKPRARIEVSREGDALCVLPTLVYGSPPSARVDAGRLVHLRGAIPVRDEAAERNCLLHLQRELGLTPGRRIRFSGDEALRFAEQLGGWRGDIEGDAHLAFRRAPALVPRLRISEQTIDLAFEVPVDESTPGSSASGVSASARAEGGAVIEAWLGGASLVSLGATGFAPLPTGWLERFGHRVADLLAARDSDGALPTCMLPDLARLCEELDEPAPARLDRLRPLLGDWQGIEPAPLPSDLGTTLREYQRRGVDWLCFLRDAGLGALLADDMGLGKTVQALCAIRGRTLVVAPTSVLHGWADEIRRFRPGLRYSLYHGPHRKLDADTDVTLTSYALLRLDADRLCQEHWQSIVLDEAQNIKNPESQVAQAAHRLQGDFRMALTGTPVENRLEELWSQLHFLNRGLLGGRKDFQLRYAKPIAEGDASAAERLRQRIRPFVMRRLKRQVAPELPPRSEVVLHCELSREERDVYDAVRAAGLHEAIQRLREGGNVMAALEVLLRLRQAACHPSLVPGQTAETSSKLDLLLERLGQAVEDGHKALVFSQWTAFLDRVEPRLRAAGLSFERLDGSTRDRAGVVERFQSEGGAPLMLVSLKAGGTGLNLTAADHIFLLDPWWNPAVEDQAADRAHRIGQRRPVVVHRLIAADTVEERIIALHAHKRALLEAALGDRSAASGLTRDDLLALLDAA